jgi:hypothetical protein
MKTPNKGDMILILATGHSYPKNWVRGQEPHRYHVDTPVIFLSEFKEKYGGFYTVLTPTGEHNVFSGYCKELQQ